MELQSPTFCVFCASSAANILLMLLVLAAMNLSVKHASATYRFGNETDRLALLEFKKQISDDPYGVLKSWNHSQHHCQWQGITCGTRHRRVKSLNLTSISLSGTISPYIGNLSFIRYINLGANQLHGQIPQEAGRLFRLRHLDLSNNTLSREIPVNLSHCSKMLYISLFSNNLQGKIPSELLNLKKLEYLYLDSNNLTGEIPSSIGNLSSLMELLLADNKLDGYLPKEMCFLTSLTVFALAINRLSGLVPASIYNISGIVVLSIAVNFFSGDLPSNIGLALPNLQLLEIGRNNFDGNIPLSITNASGLKILDLGFNHFHGQVPTNLGHFPNLEIFQLGVNHLGSNSKRDLRFTSSLTNSSKLQLLDLGQNNFGGVIPKVIANLSYQLSYLYLGENQLSGPIPEGLGNFVNLSVLDISWNSLSGVIPSDFGKFQNLQRLALDNNRLSGEILSTSLCNVTTLYYLALSDNQFEGDNMFDNVLINCQNLQELYIDQNNLSGVISPQFFEMHSSLVNMTLGENTLSGSLPLEVGKLIHLLVFNVSYNNFSGEIPATLVGCSNLEYLYMQANSFHGKIPQNLASLKSIQELDLSSNNLTGQIPKDLDKLQYLRSLNLSFNDLEGEIPTTGIFGNASQISLFGNNKLCGGIPELNFPPCPVFKGKKVAKLKVVIVLSTVLPVMVVVLGILSFYYLIYRRKSRRQTSSSRVPARVNKLFRVSYHDLHRATSGFSPENLIGSGSFGVVYKGRLDQHGNKLVAVKVLDLQKNGAFKSFKAECRTLRNIRHRNLVSILSNCSSIDSKGHEFKALVYEFMENGNLDLWLHPETTDQETRSTYLNLSQKLNIAIDVASAMDYLHTHCGETEIVHCDLKPSNILLDNDLVAHVGDFGLARLLPKSVNTSSEQGTSSTIAIKGSIGYAAPEYGMGLGTSTQGDVYSYGILLLEMMAGRRPTDDMFVDDLNLYNYVNTAFPEHVHEVVDPLLLSEAGDEYREIDGGRKMECVVSLLKIGLKCSTRLPNDRMPMNEVLRKLHLIKDVFLGIRVLHQENLEA